MARCMQCGKELTHNEIGAHRKFINAAQNSFSASSVFLSISV